MHATPDNTLIRNAQTQDAAELADLYNHYILNTPITFDTEPYTVEARAQWMQQFNTTGRHRLLVAEHEGRVIGYACSQQFRPKRGYDTSIETSIYLHHNTTARGLGSQLYTALFDVLKDEHIHRAYAGVTLPNEASVSLHKKFGFQELGVFNEVGFKMDQYWSVQWLEKTVSHATG